MSKFKVKYFIHYGNNYGYYIDDIPFEPEDVQDYYDLWSDGSITLYIKMKYKKWVFPFICVEREEIRSYRDDMVKMVILETPERRQCGKA